MRKIVVDMQNFLFADSVATAFKKSDYEIDVVRTESPKDTVELCKLYKPFVLIMEVTGYTPWKLCERMKLRDEVKRVLTVKLLSSWIPIQKNRRQKTFGMRRKTVLSTSSSMDP